MTLESLANLGEFVGAIGVLLSLVYLAVQIRQNTRTVRSSTHQAWVSATAEVNMLLPQSPEFTRVYRAGSQDPTSLEPDELAQFTLYMLQVFNNFEALYFQFLEGTVDEAYWKWKVRGLLVILAAPGGQYAWSGAGELFLDPRFREAVQRLLASSPAA
jgi:hypothetical protein